LSIGRRKRKTRRIFRKNDEKRKLQINPAGLICSNFGTFVQKWILDGKNAKNF